MNAPLQLVWFKRDLRVADHAPLAEAAACGPVLPLYIVEPGLWRQPDMAGRHWGFIHDCLGPLRGELARLGQPLVIRVGEAVEVLGELITTHRIGAVWSHQETGNDWTFRRDLAVGALLRERGIPWHERRQHGVVRGLANRDRWSSQWEALMAEPTVTPPDTLSALPGVDPGPLPDWPAEQLAADPCPGRQAGGRRAALQVLAGFLEERGDHYHQRMSSPLTAPEACSRLSPHLAWGSLSIREVVQATRHRRAELKASARGQLGTWSRALSAFDARLHWHCHFIQKLESEPRLEFENLHPVFDGLRESGFDRGLFNAWCEGQTGLPLVDACMRALQATGWINFRMRAMLVAVSSYHLWLHWREPALHLARLFTDYEPGIHYPQVQMQSGTTGINSVRIYNPVKQSRDQDPEGVFIRRWLPELAGVPDDWIHTPWQMSRSLQTRSGCRIGNDYPAPVVEHEQAARRARQRIAAARRSDGAWEQSQAILARHGSRKGSSRRRPKQADASGQGELFD